MKNENQIIAIGGYRKNKSIEDQIKDELILQGYTIISLFETQSKEEIISLIQNCDILLILNEDGYTDNFAVNQVIYALQNQKIVIFLSDYLLIKNEVINRLNKENYTEAEKYIKISDMIDGVKNHMYTFKEIIDKIIIKIKEEAYEKYDKMD